MSPTVRDPVALSVVATLRGQFEARSVPNLSCSSDYDYGKQEEESKVFLRVKKKSREIMLRSSSEERGLNAETVIKVRKDSIGVMSRNMAKEQQNRYRQTCINANKNKYINSDNFDAFF